ncbi:MAG: hypothetical protein J0665_01445 [Deltaproteobacteria bacterium]|nr:hypothetical protein [Deltaproteobacteria bacterium]
MNSVKNYKSIKCPQCGGKGVVFEILGSEKVNSKNMVIKRDDSEELHIPNLTGTKEQCDEAIYIRARFIQMARKHYQAELFNTFIKLISYESHSFFWIWNEDCKIKDLIAKIAVKNPTPFDLMAGKDLKGL